MPNQIGIKPVPVGVVTAAEADVPRVALGGVAEKYVLKYRASIIYSKKVSEMSATVCGCDN
jgi:hypothetical protein